VCENVLQIRVSNTESRCYAMDTERNISEPSGRDLVLEKFNLGLTNVAIIYQSGASNGVLSNLYWVLLIKLSIMFLLFSAGPLEH